MTTFTEEFVRDFRDARGRVSSKPNKKPNGGKRNAAYDNESLVRLDPRDPMRSARELIAARFIDSNGQRLLHRHRARYWLFAEGCYRAADDDAIRAAAWQFLDSAIREKGGRRPFKPTRSRVSDIIDALGSICHLDGSIDPPAWLASRDNDPRAAELFPVANGLLHLLSGKLLPPTPRYFGLTASNVVFDREAPHPNHWLAFLRELFGDDVEAIAALQEFFGYSLAPDTSQQKIMLIVGPTRSGKGTIARVLTGLIGRDNVAAPTLATLQTNFGLAPLIGKPLAIISDARLGARPDQAAIVERLLSISGEDAITIDRKFQPAWTGRLPTRFVLLSNELPRLSDNSGALAKRLVVLALERSFYGKEDLTLIARLQTELPSILNWAREGYVRLRERGYFVQPASGHDAVEQLEELASPVTAFVRECCQIRSGLTTRIELLYQSWRVWCDTNGRREPGTAQTFGRDLKAAFPAIKATNPRRSGDDRARYYEGIGLVARDGTHATPL